MMNQEDCQEFVNFLFDLIEKELKGTKNSETPTSGGNEQDGTGEANGKTESDDVESIKQLKSLLQFD